MGRLLLIHDQRGSFVLFKVVSRPGLALMGLLAWVAPMGQAQAAVTCAEYSPAGKGYDSAAQWDTYAPPSPTELQQLGLSGQPATLAHGQLLSCKRLSAWNSWAYTGLNNLDTVTVTRHVTADATGVLALGSAAVFMSSKSPTEVGADYRPVMVINSPTIGIPAQCGPSVQLLNNKGILKDKVQKFLDRGYNVVVPDYFGLGIRGQRPHPYLEGKSSGQSVLDAIVAVQGMSASPLQAKTPLVMQGYSQGGQVTVWATHLASTYAPSLKFAAVRAGGVPIDLWTAMNSLIQTNDTGGTESGLVPLALVGMMNATDPSTRVSEAQILGAITTADKSHALRLLERARTVCRETLKWDAVLDNLYARELNLSTLSYSAEFQNWVIKNSLTGATAKGFFGALAQVSIQAPLMASPSMPFTLYNVQGDTAIPAASLQAMVDQYWTDFVRLPKTSLGYTNVTRSNKAWILVTDPIGHGLGETVLYTDDFPATRYTPDEWLYDSVYQALRTNLLSNGDYADRSGAVTKAINLR
jgi:dienelactone hydrolase